MSQCGSFGDKGWDSPSPGSAFTDPIAVRDKCCEAIQSQGETLNRIVSELLRKLAESITEQGKLLDRSVRRLERVVRDSVRQSSTVIERVVGDLHSSLQSRVSEQQVRLNQVAPDNRPPGGLPPMPGPNPLPQQIQRQGQEQGQRQGQEQPAPAAGRNGAGAGQQPQQPPANQPQQPPAEDKGKCGLKEGEQAPANAITIQPWGSKSGNDAWLGSECGIATMAESISKSLSLGKFSEGLEAENPAAKFSSMAKANLQWVSPPDGSEN